MLYSKKDPLTEIKKIIFWELWKAYDYKVFLFWSRAKWDFKENSDYDIGILWKHAIEPKKKMKIISQLSETPRRVDIVDFYSVDQEFRRLAMQKIVELSRL